LLHIGYYAAAVDNKKEYNPRIEKWPDGLRNIKKAQLNQSLMKSNASEKLASVIFTQISLL
jgi:hypothetical protein